MTAQVYATHSPRFIKMREGPFEQFPALSQQTLATRAANPPPISIHGMARLGLILPLAAPAIRLRDVAAQAHGFKSHQHLITVIPFVPDELFRPIAILYDRLDLLGGLDQRLNTGGAISLSGVLQRHGHHRSGVQIDCVLGLVRQVRSSIFHLGNLGVRVVRMAPVVVGALVLSLAVKARQLLAAGRLYARGLCQLSEKFLIALARIASDDTTQCRVGFERSGVNADCFPSHQARFGQPLKDPGKDRLVRLV